MTTNLTTDEKITLINKYEDNHNTLSDKINKLFGNNNNSSNNNDVNITENVYKDLNIYSDSDGKETESVFSTINNTRTLYGKHILKNWIDSPTLNINLLKTRQKNIKIIIKDAKLYKNICNRLKNIKYTEGKILWFWEELSDEIKSLYDMIYFDLPIVGNYMNNNELILNSLNLYKIFGAPIFSVFIPILTFIIPYIIMLIYKRDISIKSFFLYIYNTFLLTFQMLNKFGFNTKTKYFAIIISLLYIFLYLQSGYYTIKQSIDTHRIINTLHKKINSIGTFVINVTEIWEIMKKSGIVLDNDGIDNDIEYFRDMFDNNIFNDNNIKVFNNKGKILSVYRRFIDNKDRLIKILKYIGEIDVYIGLSEMYVKGYNFVRYMDKKTPYVNIEKFWHPVLKKPVTNDIILGGKKNNNMLITGPNKSGKSIFIKSLAITVLFSQTIGIVPCKKIRIVPFNIINSYLHIPDSTGHSSLFEAEMYRAKNHIDKLKENNKLSFIIMDEIFTSTNFVEGYSSAYAITKKLSQFKNSISIITTHFTELSSLEKETDGKIKNYKFTIDRDDNGIIVYKYKLEEGYSEQFIALELLEDTNFDDDIIDSAKKMCDKVRNKVLRLV